MRIRKRFLSLSAALATDLHGNHPQEPLLPVQQLHPNQHDVGYVITASQFPDPPNQCHRPSPSHPTTQIGLQPSTWVPSGDTKIFKGLESERVEELTKTNDTRKESILSAEANNHDLVMKGWLEGDRLVPTRKKRGSNGTRFHNDVVQGNEIGPKPKRDDKLVAMSSRKNNKNEKREGVIMEGSRCSRVNGRGWRCSQQTLVGYSLCEHHLGKGRVRSMTSVRGRAQTVAPKEQHTKERKDKKAESPSVDNHDEVEDDDEEEFKDWDVESMSSMEGTKVFSKKMKVGVVKARSLSSLLSQISS